MPIRAMAEKISALARPLIKKKRVLIFASGDRITAEVIKESLERDYQVMISDLLALNFWTRFLNACLFRQKRWLQLLFHHPSGKFARFLLSKLQTGLKRFLSSSRPHLIISTLPFINSQIACVAQELSIPFLIVPTDLNETPFIEGFSKKDLFPDLKVALAYDEKWQKERLKKFPFEPHHLSRVGFPVRALCLRKLSEYDIAQLKKKHSLLEDFYTVTLTMEGADPGVVFQHVEALSAFDPKTQNLSIQLNICVGTSSKLNTQIRRFLLNHQAAPLSHSSFMTAHGLVIHLHEGLKDLLELVAASDVLITNLRSRSINEAAYLQKPVLIDLTRMQAVSENKDPLSLFVKRYGFGLFFTNSAQLHMLIPSLLKYPEHREKTLDLPSFEHQIFKLVKEMID